MLDKILTWVGARSREDWLLAAQIGGGAVVLVTAVVVVLHMAAPEVLTWLMGLVKP